MIVLLDILEGTEIKDYCTKVSISALILFSTFKKQRNLFDFNNWSFKLTQVVSNPIRLVLKLTQYTMKFDFKDHFYRIKLGH